MSEKTLNKKFRDTLVEVCTSNFDQGLGYFQESVILKQTARRLNVDPIGEEACRLLTAWHALLAEGLISPGVNLDNPGLPFLHLTPEGMKFFKKKRLDPGR